MKGITPCLWFDGNGEEAARFYASIFEDSRVGTVARHGPETAARSGQPEGSALTVEFELAGQAFLALNGGPGFPFDEAVSFIVHCESQEEIDHYWNSLVDGGEASRCGWLRDRYGLSWQVVPSELDVMLEDGGEAASRVMQALLGMGRVDLDTLRRARAGKDLGRAREDRRP